MTARKRQRIALAWSWTSTVILTVVVGVLAAVRPQGWWEADTSSAWWTSVLLWVGLLGVLGTASLVSLVASWIRLGQLDRADEAAETACAHLEHFFKANRPASSSSPRPPTRVRSEVETPAMENPQQCLVLRQGQGRP